MTSIQSSAFPNRWCFSVQTSHQSHQSHRSTWCLRNRCYWKVASSCTIDSLVWRHERLLLASVPHGGGGRTRFHSPEDAGNSKATTLEWQPSDPWLPMKFLDLRVAKTPPKTNGWVHLGKASWKRKHINKQGLNSLYWGWETSHL